MKVLSTEEIRNWDQYTIKHEPIASINLMERAATACVKWLESNGLADKDFVIFCGKGNNGGDGLAIARLLAARGYIVNVEILEFGNRGTDDFQNNLARLHEIPRVNIRFIQSEEHFPLLKTDNIVIDALVGSGLNRGLDGITARLVEHINESGCEVIAVDIPTGLFVDHSSNSNVIIKADHTLSFQCYKLALLVAENAEYIGNVHILDIGLHPDFIHAIQDQVKYTDQQIIHSIYKPRNRFAHKGNFGHALLVAGSYGKTGAAVLAARACMRSGTGLLTCHIPKTGYEIMQIAVPEAMVMSDFNSSFNTKIDDDLTKYKAIGIGPGIGTASETRMLLSQIFGSYKSPVVVDADALNLMAAQKNLLKMLPGGSILTPHPKEYERLFGESGNDFDRLELSLKKARELNCVIILKGHHTLITTPNAEAFFNSTGNPGMATAGSGDVLTGILTGLLAQGYSSVETAILGVYLHGLAGDIASEKYSMAAMVAGDIVDCIGDAFLTICGTID